jgi:hypothetical protein
MPELFIDFFLKPGVIGFQLSDEIFRNHSLLLVAITMSTG